MLSRVIAVLAALLLLSGCVAHSPPRPLTSEAEALALYGEPVRRWQNDDGTSTLEYSNQPYGHETLMVTVDAGGIVLRQEQALAFDNLARVEVGMTREQVSRLLGTHRSVQTFALSGEEVWDWNVYNDGPGIETRFNVHFIDGRVVRTSRTYVFPRDNGFFGYAYPPYPYYAYPFPYRARLPYRGWPRRGPYWYPW